MLFIIVLVVLAVAAIVATFIEVLTDGYRPVAMRPGTLRAAGARRARVRR
ncbi:hypothetical protein [Subtercola vilae]|nr:hypothetical protein [Subtercola vilae]